jgi:hypothetical protein
MISSVVAHRIPIDPTQVVFEVVIRMQSGAILAQVALVLEAGRSKDECGLKRHTRTAMVD